MGWWETEDGVLVGDGPLDECEELLERVSSEYSDEYGRKPTLRELLTCFALVLRHQADNFVADADEILITDVVARTKKRPRKPRLRPGDVFSVPLGTGEFAFGRLTPQDGVVDFFTIKSRVRLGTSKLKAVKTLRFPGAIALSPLLERRWKIVGHLPYADNEFQVQRFKMAGLVACGDGLLDGFIDVSSRLEPATAAELASLPEFALWGEELVEEWLKERLR